MNIPSLDFGLGEDINLLREAVKAFADAEIAPRAAEIDRVNEFPADLWKKFGDMGLLGMTVSPDWNSAAIRTVFRPRTRWPITSKITSNRFMLQCVLVWK